MLMRYFSALVLGWFRYAPPVGKRTSPGEHVSVLRSRERGCFLVVQTLWAEKIQSTTDAGSLNTFGRNEIEVAPISSALLRIACLVILYKTPYSGPRTGSRWGYQAVWGLALDYLSKMKIAIVVRHLGHILCCGRMVRVERVYCIRVRRGLQSILDIGNHGVIGFDPIRGVLDLFVPAFPKDELVGSCVAHHRIRRLVFALCVAGMGAVVVSELEVIVALSDVVDFRIGARVMVIQLCLEL